MLQKGKKGLILQLIIKSSLMNDGLITVELSTHFELKIEMFTKT